MELVTSLFARVKGEAEVRKGYLAQGPTIRMWWNMAELENEHKALWWPVPGTRCSCYVSLLLLLGG